MPAKILFLTLRVFSITGGIEKVNRVAGHVINNMPEFLLKVFALHDKNTDVDEKYFPPEIFKGFSGSRVKFVVESVASGSASQIVILSHINLLSVGYYIKKISPKTKVLVFAHGIEIWKPLSKRKQKMLRRCDQVISVSQFTRDVIIKNQSLDPAKCLVLNNCLDPFLPEKTSPGKPVELLEKYGFRATDFILLTLTRLSYKEKYKGYEKVMRAMTELLGKTPCIKYLIVGKYSVEEKERLDKIVIASGLTGKVVFTGFIDDRELAKYYSLADLYVMPSKKEGFGIVFIEAMNYGLPVIGGNKDGSVDALANGSLGIIADPDDQQSITGAIAKVMSNGTAFIPDRELLLNKFSSTTYATHLKTILLGSLN